MVLQRSHIQNVLKSYLKTENFEIISWGSSEADDVAIGFLSTQDKVSVRYRSRGEDGILHVFIKTLPDSPYQRQNVVSMGGFHREVVLYNEILNSYQQKLKDNTIPECYLSTDEIIVLEDVSKKGFKNKGIHDTFDVAHCEKALEALGKFHSLSFLTEKKEGRRMPELLPIIKTEVILSKEENHIGRRVVLISIRALKAVIDKYVTSYPPETKKKVFDLLDNVFDDMKSSKLYPNVLAHSDTWGNNFMFRYDDNGAVAEASIFDFQLATYKPPSYDILLFLHTTTETEMRARYFDHLMKHYYSTLSRCLTSWGMNIEEVLTWSDFENMLKETLPLALVQATLFLLFVLVPEDILKPVMASDEKFKVYYEGDRNPYILAAMEEPTFRRRILQALTNLFDYCSSE